MKKAGKIVLTVLCVLSFINIAFWVGIYYLDGLSHLYYSQHVVNSIYVFSAITSLALIILIAIIVMMFKSKKIIRIVCTLLLILFLPAALYGSFVGMACSWIMGSNGCSYTEDITNYGKYDNKYDIPYFPDAITEDMTVVQFAYFYKYVDVGQTDIYLEVKFENREIMDEYLTTAKNSLSETGILSYQNPYNPKYTDIIRNKWVQCSAQDEYLASVVNFCGDEDYKYVDMNYNSISYSYDDLTIIYNYTYIGSDIEVGNDPDHGKYYPKFLERFGVEWKLDNTFKYEYVEE